MIPTTTTRPKNPQSARYWIDVIGDTKKIGRICQAADRTVRGWIETDHIPAQSVFLLKLYIGEISMSEWEDIVEEV